MPVRTERNEKARKSKSKKSTPLFLVISCAASPLWRPIHFFRSTRRTAPIDTALSGYTPYIREILVQECFLIQKPPYEHRHEEDERAESPPRAERKRGPYEQRRHSGIHRVAHDGVRARRDDRLPLGYLDRGSSITILAND